MFAFVFLHPEAERNEESRLLCNCAKSSCVVCSRRTYQMGTDIILWIRILTPCRYLKNWILMNVKLLSKTLLERIVLVGTTLLLMVLSIILIECVFTVKFEKKTRSL